MYTHRYSLLLIYIASTIVCVCKTYIYYILLYKILYFSYWLIITNTRECKSKLTKSPEMYRDPKEGRIAFLWELIREGNILLSYFNHPPVRTRAPVYGQLLQANAFLHSRKRPYRGNMNGKMNGISFCSRTSSARFIHRVSIFSASSLRSFQPDHRSRPGHREMPRVLFISGSTDESGSRRLSDDHLASINNTLQSV